MSSFEGLNAGPGLNADTVRALEVFKVLTRTAEGRRDFVAAAQLKDDEARTAAIQELFDRLIANPPVSQLPAAAYSDIPVGVRRVLEHLSDSELALFSDIDAAYVAAGLWLTSNPVEVMAH
jgi:hypothetical protein